MEYTLVSDFELARPREEVFAFFSDAGNLERITPPELRFRILTPQPIAMKPGAIIDYRLQLFGIPFRWKTLISEWEPPFRFVDQQLTGPYAQWIHTHTFEPTAAGGTHIRDVVRYRLPLAPLSSIGHFLIKRQLARIFSHREAAVREHLGPGQPA